MNVKPEAALSFARKGMPVFPCKPGEKVPQTLHGFKDATTDPSTIGQWWTGWPEANIAIATGEKSRVFVLDIDVKNGAPGLQSIAKLEAEYGKLPETLTATTPSGGLHHFFRYPQEKVPNRTAFRPGLDIRGEGGYVVVAPSVIGGTSYAWQNEHTEPVEAPSWLLDIIHDKKTGCSLGVAKMALHGVPAGMRNASLFAYAASLVGRAVPYSEAKILALHAAANCTPTFPEEEALRCLDSAYGRYTPDIHRPHTDLGNAERLVDRFGNHIRFVPAYSRWLLWNGKRWVSSELGEINQLGKAVVRAIQEEATRVTDEDIRKKTIDHGRNSESAKRLDSLIALTAVEQGIPLAAEQLDADDWLFGVSNGAVNLKTGALRDPQPEDHITKYGFVAHDTSATCPQWERFILEIMGGDENLAHFLQRCVGYTLAGGNPEQTILVLHGNGANGKSTFLRTMQVLLGSYARAADSSLFMVRKFQSSGGPREDIVRLKDARFVLTTEVGEGEWLDEDLVKRMTGDDTLAGRVPFGKSTIEFQPKFTPWMATNHCPIIRGDDHAIWRRIMLVPFTQTFKGEKKDTGLIHKLRAEMSGILNWAIQGCLTWQKEGLNPPKTVLAATREYRDEMDLLGEWIGAECQLGQGHEAKTSELYSSYRYWCVVNETKPLSRQAFGRKLKSKNFESAWIKGERGWRGIGLKQTRVRAAA